MDIPLHKRTKIVTLSEYTNISQRNIATIVGVSQKSVSNIIELGNEPEGLQTRRKGNCGRKAKATPQAIQILVTESERDPRKTSHQLRIHLEETAGISISSRTVRRCLVNAGRVARRPVKKQLLTEAMKIKRLQWAENHQDWTKEDWRRVLFSDESHFFVQGQRSQHIRRAKGEKLCEAHIDQYVKKPLKRMFWGSFSYNGMGSLYPVKGMMNSQQYIDVINQKVTKDMEEAFPQGGGIYMHDSAPCHKAKKVAEVLRQKDILVLDWPGNSPDLNPIENLWSILKLEQSKHDCTTMEKLTKVIIDIWFNEAKMEDHCSKLVDSMPARIQQVINNGGGHTSY